MSTDADSTDTTSEQLRSDRGGRGSSAPDAHQYACKQDSKPRRLRATDSDERREQTNDHSAGWRSVYRSHGVEPEGWRR